MPTPSNLPVTKASPAGTTHHVRNEQLALAGDGNPIVSQVVLLAEMEELPVTPDGLGNVRQTVTATAAVSLSPPAAGARYARVRIWHGTQDQTKRLYYRSDGTAPLANGTNVFGYLVHGEIFYVKLATKANWKMIAETGETFEVYVEWLNIP